MLDALLRSLSEQSMRVQFRCEVVEDLGDLLEQYVAGQRSERKDVAAFLCPVRRPDAEFQLSALLSTVRVVSSSVVGRPYLLH
jgi:hypothetical protein